ncbi:MAG: hypothetical protein AAF628_34280 [Planctomycetota bacterium]
MHRLPPVLLVTAILAPTVIAQVPPALVHQDTSFLPARPGYEPRLVPTAFGGSASSTLRQLEVRPFTITPGTFRVAATLSDPNGTFPGAAGGTDVVEVIWDPDGIRGPAGVLPTNRCAVFNSPQAEFSLTISHNGLVGATDRLFRPQFQVRANPVVAFASPTRLVSGMPGTGPGSPAVAGLVDSALCQINGQLTWAYVDPNGDISTSTFTLTPFAPNLTGQVVRYRFAMATTTAQSLHSPHPIEDSDGDALAFMASVLHMGGTGDSDTYFFPSLNNAELGGINSGHRLWDDPFWQANGSASGATGTLYLAHGAPAPFLYQAPLRMGIVGHNGGLMIPGTLQAARVWVPDDGDPWIGGMLFGVTPTSFAVPFATGHRLGTPRPPGILGLVPLPAVLTLPIADGGATANINIPRGTPVGLGPFVITQSFAFNLTANELFLGNTAWLGT